MVPRIPSKIFWGLYWVTLFMETTTFFAVLNPKSKSGTGLAAVFDVKANHSLCAKKQEAVLEPGCAKGLDVLSLVRPLESLNP